MGIFFLWLPKHASLALRLLLLLKKMLPPGRACPVMKKSPSPILPLRKCCLTQNLTFWGLAIILPGAAGLQAGKHIIVDKPLCTSISECDQIARLAAEKKRSVSCMFGMRSSPTFRMMKKAIAEGAIGTVRTLCITGQHPLMLGTRPAWYFEEGKHGGTINDIGIHAVDLIPWLTGLQIKEVCAARCWNAKAAQTPWFKDCAQVMLKLNNDAGVIADFSYLSPDRCGFAVRQYWRVTVHGDKGVLECQNQDNNLMFANSDSSMPESIPCNSESQADSFLEQLIREIEGKTIPGQLTTDYVLKTSRKALEIQQEAKLF